MFIFGVTVVLYFVKIFSGSRKFMIVRHIVEISVDDVMIYHFYSVNSKLDGDDNLAAIFEAKLVINRVSSSVLFYCFSRRG